jgi:hypothetical protein
MPNSHETSRGGGIWFPAKTGYGWGWGLPITWQGWAVYAGWLALVVGSILWLEPQHPTAHGVFMLVAGALLIAVCYAKGERPRWRWGRD